MSSPDIRDWDLDSIVERDIRVSDEIHEILKKWDDEYKGIPAEDKPVATEEEVTMINHLKEKGLIWKGYGNSDNIQTQLSRPAI